MDRRSTALHRIIGPAVAWLPVCLALACGETPPPPPPATEAGPVAKSTPQPRDSSPVVARHEVQAAGQLGPRGTLDEAAPDPGPTETGDSPRPDSKPANRASSSASAKSRKYATFHRVSEKRYEVTVAKRGGAGTNRGYLRVRVEPRNGWHLNLEFPTRMKLESAGLSIERADQKPADARRFDEDRFAFEFPYRPNRPGEHPLSGEAKFAVCEGDEACLPVRVPIIATVPNP